jgi:hypothetical protein
MTSAIHVAALAETGAQAAKTATVRADMTTDPQPRPAHCDHCRCRLPDTGTLYVSAWGGEDLCRSCAEREQDIESTEREQEEAQ